MMRRIRSLESPMRTTLAIDDDVLAAAKHLAEREHRSVGEVISSLAGKASFEAHAPPG